MNTDLNSTPKRQQKEEKKKSTLKTMKAAGKFHCSIEYKEVSTQGMIVIKRLSNIAIAAHATNAEGAGKFREYYA